MGVGYSAAFSLTFWPVKDTIYDRNFHFWSQSVDMVDGIIIRIYFAGV